MRIAICDDEADQREVMLSFVCQYNPTLAVDTYDAAIDLLLAVEKIPYDIVFMDIEMPAPNGFEIAQQLKVKSNSPLVIFVTKSNSYTIQGYGVAFRYLAKPISYAMFSSVLSLALKEREPAKVSIVCDNKLMNKQMTISAFSDELAQVRTKKKEFLSQIERIVPWGEWLAMIQPCYYKGERGNKPYPLEIMLRLYLLQNLYDLSDEATVAEAIDSRAFSEFCSVDSSNQVPDGDTLGRFRNLLIRNGLQEKLFAQVVAALMERGLILKKGTIVDSTIISAPSSTKNKEKKRDPDAHQVKKGNTWHFGYKAHIGVDKDSGLVHTVKATAANVHDVSETSKLLTGEEEAVYGDSGYLGAGKREDAVVRNKSGHRIKYKINRRPSQVKKLSKSGQYAAKKAEHAKSSVRAKVEHVFGVVKKQLHFRKTRYRGLEKQQAKFNIMFALANLILADRPCLAA